MTDKQKEYISKVLSTIGTICLSGVLLALIKGEDVSVAKLWYFLASSFSYYIGGYMIIKGVK